ncbi:hypothetical protein PVK06_043358 [Gossypium arboreum]|uniref:CCHC-type domain-containing protein n=1 Tax=Gossypium arboreum TaxID=29729 RepID=A0ABR0MNI7_GOSAR|nr:hypothetical protein PVK06_043358 [Gossypium arboreum]
MSNPLCGDNGDGSCSVGDRNTKKKEKLFGKRLHDQKGGVKWSVLKRMMILHFLDGDIKRSSINGVPSIEFLDRVNQLLIKEMSTSLVLKLLGQKIGFAALQNQIYGLRKPSMSSQLMDIKNRYFLVKFQNSEDYEKLLTQGPWIMYGLPGHLYKKRILWEISGMVGKNAKLDFNTDSKARGKYARMAVYINLGKPLLSQVLINGNIQRIEYESLPVVCFSCGRYGHFKEACTWAKEVVTNPVGKDLMADMAMADAGTVVDEGPFGPWMIME